MSKLEVDKIDPQSGTNLELGTSGDTVTIPTGVTLDASNATTTLPANVVTTDGSQTLTNKSIAATQLTGTITPSDSSVTTAKLADSSVTNAKVNASAAIDYSKLNLTGNIALADLSATGTKDDTTFLRGDNTFATAGGGTETGSVIIMPISTVPTGYLECDGSAVSRTTYADLFTVISTTYGSGNGSTTFNIPDLRGEFVRGWDNGRGQDSGRSIATSQTDQFQGHWHNVRTGLSGGNYVSRSNGGFSSAADYDSARTIISDGSNGTPRIGNETRPKNIAMMYCIKF